MANDEEKALPKLQRKPSKAQKDIVKHVAEQREDTSAFIRHLSEACKLCLHEERADIEIAYTTGASVRSLSKEFNVSQRIINAHADAMEWKTARLRNTDAIMGRLYGDVLDSLDVTKLSPRDKIEFLTRMAHEQNRIQGRIVSKMDINANKSVTFIGIPLPGGAPPILPEGKKLLASGTVIEAQFLHEEDSHGSGEAVEAAGSLLAGVGQGAEVDGKSGSDRKQRF